MTLAVIEMGGGFGFRHPPYRVSLCRPRLPLVQLPAERSFFLHFRSTHSRLAIVLSAGRVPTSSGRRTRRLSWSPPTPRLIQNRGKATGHAYCPTANGARGSFQHAGALRVVCSVLLHPVLIMGHLAQPRSGLQAHAVMGDVRIKRALVQFTSARALAPTVSGCSSRHRLRSSSEAASAPASAGTRHAS
jgi:hypothetical protein